MEPLECTIFDILIPAITGHNCSQIERDVLDLPVRLVEGGGGLGFTNPRKQAESEYAVSVKIIA